MARLLTVALALLWGALALPGCQGGSSVPVVVVASAVPAAALRLDAVLTLGGQPVAGDYGFNLAGVPGQALVRFGLLLGSGAGGELAVALRALDPARCVLAMGSGQGAVHSGAQIAVALHALPSGTCVTALPVLSGVLPAVVSSTGLETVTISGLGFQPGAVVQIGGQTAGMVMVTSPQQIVAQVPALRGMLGLATVQVTNPDGSQGARGDLLRVRASGLKFSLKTYNTGSAADGVLYGLAVGELNGDGYLDVVETVGTKVIVLLTNGAAGTFRRADYPAPKRPTGSVLVADLRGTGKNDIVYGEGYQVATMTNPGNGVFPTDSIVHHDQGSDVAGGMDVVDLGRTGRLAVVAPSTNSRNLNVFSNRGDRLVRLGYDYLRSSSCNATAADLDQDGWPDLVVRNTKDGNYAFDLHMNPKDGTPGLPSKSYPAPELPFATYLFHGCQPVADVTGDGWPDLVLTDPTNSQLLIRPNLGRSPQSGEWLGLGAHVTYPVGGATTCAALGDLDGDGRPDVALTGTLTGKLVLLLNRGGTYASQDGPERVTLDAPPGPYRVVVADMDNDGRSDVIVGLAVDASFHIFYNVSE